MYIGAHISIAKGFARAVQSAHGIGANTMQFFTRNPRGAKAKTLDESDIKEYLQLVEKLEFGSVVAHSPYTINLASPDEDAWGFAIETTVEDLHRIGRLKAPYLCIHPGSHVGSGMEVGIRRISQALNQVFNKANKVNNNTMILLETMAGTGTEIGSTFEELRAIMEHCDYRERLGICFDTCHAFCAGYDLKNNLEYVLKHFDKVIGINKLKAFHLNDSLKPMGSKRDRHALLGEGELGVDFFKGLVRLDVLKHIPFILETPGGMEVYPREINMLRNGVIDNSE
ncbi:MAG: deoxyribonuclease IV [Clostridia bacterium]|nr:deoxyribonuclease IV [Clostridia bacterium]